MTISTTTNRITYAGNGSTTAFAYPYNFLAAGDLVVIIVSALGVETTQILGVNYTVSGGSGTSGVVTMTTAPASGTTLVIYRDPPITQETDYVANDPFPAETHERALDRLTMIAQRLNERVGQTLRVSEGEGSIAPLPPKSSRSGAYAYFDAVTGALTTAPSAVTVGTAATVFDTLAAVGLTTFTTAPGAIQTLGYNTAGDGGGALYVKVASEPAHGLKVQSGDGTWYELDPRQVLTLEMAGAVGDDSTDNATAFGAFSTFVETYLGADIRLRPERTYVSSGDLEFHSATVRMVGAGVGSSVLKFTGNASLSLRNADWSVFDGIRFLKETAATNVVAFEQSLAAGDSGSQNVSFFDCSFEGGDETVYLTNVLNIRFTCCRFQNTIGTRCVNADGSNFISASDTSTATAQDNVDVIEFTNCSLRGSGSGGQDVVVLNGKADSAKFVSTAVLFGDVGIRMTSTGTALANGHYPDFFYFTGGGFENSDESAIIMTYGGKSCLIANCYVSTDPTGNTDNISIASTYTGNLQLANVHVRAAGRDGIRAQGGTLQITGCYFDRNGVNTTGDHIRIESGVRLTSIVGSVLENSTGSVSRHGIFINTTNPVMIAAVETNGLTGSAVINNASNVQAKQAAIYDYDVPDIEYNVQVAGALSPSYERVLRVSSGAYRLVRLGGLVSADTADVRVYFTPQGGSRTAVATANTTITTTETYTSLFTDPVIDASGGGLIELRIVSVTGSAADLDVVIGLQRILEG